MEDEVRPQKRGLLFYWDIVLVVLGVGLVIANLVSIPLIGRMASPPALIGGLIIAVFAVWRMVKRSRNKQRVP